MPNVQYVDTDPPLPNVKTQQFCVLVTTLSDLYENDLFDSDVLLGGATKFSTYEVIDKLVSGHAASIPTLPSSSSIVSYIVNNPNRDPEATFVFLPPPIGEYGQGTVRPKPGVSNSTAMAIAGSATDDQIRAALQILELMRLTRTGHGLMRHGTGYAIDHLGLTEVEQPPKAEQAPHFPYYPYYQLYYMHAVTDGPYGAELLQYLSEPEKRQWARMPPYWWLQSDDQMRQIFNEVAPTLNPYLWDSFVSLVASPTSQSCEMFQESLSGREGLNRAWTRTMSAGTTVDPDWIKVAVQRWEIFEE